MEAVPEALTKTENSLCNNDLRPKINCISTEIRQNCMNTLGNTFQSDQHISSLDQIDKSISYSSLSKYPHSKDKKCISMESRMDLHIFSPVRDLDPRTNYVTDANHLNSFDSNDTGKSVSIFSKDCVNNYFCRHREQAWKDSPLISEIQCGHCSGNPGELNRVCGEKTALQILTAIGENVKQRNIDRLESLDNPGLKGSKIIKDLEAVEETFDGGAGALAVETRLSDLLEIGEMVVEDSESLTLKDDTEYVNLYSNIRMVSDTLSKEDNKMVKCGQEDVWVKMDSEMKQDHESLVQVGKTEGNISCTLAATEEKLTERKKEMGTGTFVEESFTDTTAGEEEDCPFGEKKENKEERNSNKKVGENEVMEEKWKTVKMAWKPSGNNLDKDFFITFPGFAINIKDTQIKFHEDWRDAVLNNYVLRHEELNSILTVRTFENFLENLVEKRLMVRTKKGLRTMGSRKIKKKKKIKNGRKYQKLEAEMDVAPNDDMTPPSPGKDTLQEAVTSCSDMHRKKDKKRRSRSKNNIFLGYICMKIVQRFSKNVLVL